TPPITTSSARLNKGGGRSAREGSCSLRARDNPRSLIRLNRTEPEAGHVIMLRWIAQESLGWAALPRTFSSAAPRIRKNQRCPVSAPERERGARRPSPDPPWTRTTSTRFDGPATPP